MTVANKYDDEHTEFGHASRRDVLGASGWPLWRTDDTTDSLGSMKQDQETADFRLDQIRLAPQHEGPFNEDYSE